MKKNENVPYLPEYTSINLQMLVKRSITKAFFEAPPWDSEKNHGSPWAVPGGGMPGRNFTSAVSAKTDGID
jgi:hypothetical protein